MTTWRVPMLRQTTRYADCLVVAETPEEAERKALAAVKKRPHMVDWVDDHAGEPELHAITEEAEDQGQKPDVP